MNKKAKKFFKDPVNIIILTVLAVFIVLAIFAPLVAPYDPDRLNMRNRFAMPSTENWLGTDEVGRDIFSRIVFGARISLTIGLLSTGIALLIGGTLGVLAGYFSKLDNLIMRFVDIILAIPTILVAIAVVGALGPGVYNLMIAIGLSMVPTFARITRSTVLPLKNIEYVDAARSLGATNLYILVRAITPNILGPIVVYGTLTLGSAILSAAILNFLGIGLDPVTPEWGAMASAGRNYLRQAPHVTFIPSIAIFLVVLAFNQLGDRLRDYLDPRKTLSGT